MSDPHAPLSVAPETDDYVRRRFFPDYDVVARAPACAFLFGGYSVVYGHLGLYLPIPRYVYVGLKVVDSETSFSADTTPLQWVGRTSSLSSPNDTLFESFQVDESPFIDEEADKSLPRAYEVIRERYFPASRRQMAVKMRVFSQAPTRSGLNSSGAIGAALTMALSAFFERPPDQAELRAARQPQAADRLGTAAMRGSPLFEELVTLGWYLDDCFHGFGGTSIGASGSMIGSDAGLPIVFMAEGRTFLDSAPQHPANYAKAGYTDAARRLEKMSQLKRMIVRLDDQLPGASPLPAWWSNAAVALIYSGQPKFTRDMLEQMNDNLERYALSGFLSQVLHIAGQRGMALNALEQLLHDQAFTNPGPANPIPAGLEWRKQHRKELMMTLMGSTSYLGMEAIFSPRQLEFVEQLRQQQDLFRILGISLPQINLICDTFGRWRNELDEQPIGTTITGGGSGGDVVIFGDRPTLEREFERLLEQVHERAAQIRTRDPITVHYRSWEEPSQAAEPARVVYSSVQ